MAPTFRIAPLAGRFRFVTDCISSTGPDIRDLVDQERAAAARRRLRAAGVRAFRAAMRATG